MTAINDRTVFLNGEYLPASEAKVSVFDRGYLLADAVYEFTAVVDGKLVDFQSHMNRMQSSLDALAYKYLIEYDELLEMHHRLIDYNELDVGGVYMQISRGVADRDFAFPSGITPTIMAFTQKLNYLDNPIVEKGLKVITIDDGRWARRDIKSVQLLYTSMAKTQAMEKGVHDALFVKDGFVTEATSANAFIVKDGCLITRSLSNDILHGVTRRAVLALAQQCGFKTIERNFTVSEALSADEVFVTASPLYVMPVVEIDGEKINGGIPGPSTRKLRKALISVGVSSAV